MYVKGPDEFIKTNKAPWIALDKIPRAVVSDHFSIEGKPAIYYAQQYFYRGLKVAHEPSWHMCVAEGELYAPVLDAVLEGRDEDARYLARKGLEKFVADFAFGRRKIDDYLFRSKSRNDWWYFGVWPEPAVEGDFSKVFVRFDTPEEAGFAKRDGEWIGSRKVGKKVREYKIMTGDGGLQYYDKPIVRSHHDVSWGKTTQTLDGMRVWFMDKKQVRPDITQYARRVQHRLVSLLDPIMKGDAANWLRLNMISGAPDSVGIDVYDPLMSELEYGRRQLFSSKNQRSLFELVH